MIFCKIRKLIKVLDKKSQEKLLATITGTTNRKQYNGLLLETSDLKQLINNPLITIGAHTHNHLSLKNLSEENCFDEIKLSKTLLEEKLKIKINHFSYPFGSESDVGEREFKFVEKLGFKSGVTTFVNPLIRKKCYSLPRIYVDEKTVGRKIHFKLSPLYFLYHKMKKIIF